jgi:hypothetical protein
LLASPGDWPQISACKAIQSFPSSQQQPPGNSTSGELLLRELCQQNILPLLLACLSSQYEQVPQEALLAILALLNITSSTPISEDNNEGKLRLLHFV